MVAAARICLNAVHVVPYRATEAERVIVGGAVDADTAAAAGAAAVAAARPMSDNSYMVQIAKVLVERTLLECG